MELVKGWPKRGKNWTKKEKRLQIPWNIAPYNGGKDPQLAYDVTIGFLFLHPTLFWVVMKEVASEVKVEAFLSHNQVAFSLRKFSIKIQINLIAFLGLKFWLQEVLDSGVHLSEPPLRFPAWWGWLAKTHEIWWQKSNLGGGIAYFAYSLRTDGSWLGDRAMAKANGFSQCIHTPSLWT